MNLYKIIINSDVDTQPHFEFEKLEFTKLSLLEINPYLRSLGYPIFGHTDLERITEKGSSVVYHDIIYPPYVKSLNGILQSRDRKETRSRLVRIVDIEHKDSLQFKQSVQREEKISSILK